MWPVEIWMCPYAAAHSFFMNNTPVLAVIIVINDDFNNWVVLI